MKKLNTIKHFNLDKQKILRQAQISFRPNTPSGKNWFSPPIITELYFNENRVCFYL